MATVIRLKRTGAKKEASFRIVVTDSREGTAGASIERIGFYNPRTSPSVVKIDAARAIHWLREGALPSDSVRSLLRKTGVWKQFHDGVEPASLEETKIVIGAPPGQRGTSQRPAPTERAPKQYDEPAPEPEVAAEPEVEAAAPEPEAAAEPEEAVASEAQEEAPAAEAEEAAAPEAEQAPAAEAEEAGSAEAEEPETADEAESEAEAEDKS